MLHDCLDPMSILMPALGLCSILRVEYSVDLSRYHLSWAVLASVALWAGSVSLAGGSAMVGLDLLMNAELCEPRELLRTSRCRPLHQC